MNDPPELPPRLVPPRGVGEGWGLKGLTLGRPVPPPGWERGVGIGLGLGGFTRVGVGSDLGAGAGLDRGVGAEGTLRTGGAARGAGAGADRGAGAAGGVRLTDEPPPEGRPAPPGACGFTPPPGFWAHALPEITSMTDRDQTRWRGINSSEGLVPPSNRGASPPRQASFMPGTRTGEHVGILPLFRPGRGRARQLLAGGSLPVRTTRGSACSRQETLPLWVVPSDL